MRLFFGIEIPNDEKERITHLKDRMKINGKVKWVETENLHITLLFLGEQILEEVLKCLLDRIKIPSFLISLKGVGFFPNEKRQRVIWIGVGKGKENIIELYNALSNQLSSINFEKEKEFSPHITIGRIKFGNIEIQGLNYESRDFKVDEFVLFKSELTQKGPIYTKLERFKLGG